MVITIGLLSLVVGALARRWPVGRPAGDRCVRHHRRGRRRRPARRRRVVRHTATHRGSRRRRADLVPDRDGARQRRRLGDAGLVARPRRLGSATVHGDDRRRRGWSRWPPPRSRASARTIASRASRRRRPTACPRSHRQASWATSWAARSCRPPQTIPPGATLSPETPFITPNNAVLHHRHCALDPADRPRQLEGRCRWPRRSTDVVDLRRPAGPSPGRARHHDRLRVERGRWRPDRQRGVAGRVAGRHLGRSRRAGRRAAGVQHIARRLDVRLPGRGRPRRPRRDDRHRHERRAAALAARVPGPLDRAGRVRLRQRDQVARARSS